MWMVIEEIPVAGTEVIVEAIVMVLQIIWMLAGKMFEALLMLAVMPLFFIVAFLFNFIGTLISGEDQQTDNHYNHKSMQGSNAVYDGYHLDPNHFPY